MSDRDYFNEETLQSYRKSLINRRNSLSSITDQSYIKILDQMIAELPEHFGEESVEHKKMVNEYIQKELRKREREKFLNFAWPFIVPFIIILLMVLYSIGGFFLALAGGLVLAIPIVPLGLVIFLPLIQWIIGKEKMNRYGTFITISLLIIFIVFCIVLSSIVF